MGMPRNEHRSRSRHVLRLWILAVFLLWGMAGCGGSPAAQAPVVSEPRVNPSTAVKPGDEVGINIDVSNTGNTNLIYSWTADGGKIIRGGNGPAATYKAPTEPGVYNVTVEVKWGDQSMRKTASIKVEPAQTSAPQPTMAPTAPTQQPTAAPQALDPTSQPAPTEPPAQATQPSVSSLVMLTTHQDGQSYPCETLARGTNAPDIKGHIWPVVFTNGRFYPQDEGGGAPRMLPNGTWFSTVRFGDCNADRDVGKTFQLIIVTADDAAHQEFLGWLKRGQTTGNWEGLVELPAGATEHLRIFITRK
jgi:hypothetical protein